MTNITKTDITIGVGILALAFLFQPISLIFSQNFLFPYISQKLENQKDNFALGASIPFSEKNLRGSKDAELFLVEYSDYECPFCHKFHASAQASVQESNGKVAWIYKHFPLSFHPNAIPAAIAAECVAKLGGNDKFWLYSDALFNNQQKLDSTSLLNYATSIGINAVQFNSCIKDPSIKQIVQKDQVEGEMFGVQGTPHTFIAKKVDDKLIFVNKINGAQPKEAVNALIAESLKTDPSLVNSETGLWSVIKSIFK